MKLAVVGTGYVGLVAGACFAEAGNDVVCVDVDEEKIASLRRGTIPIYEPGLQPIVERNLREGRLGFTTDLAAAVARAQTIFLAVGTPPGPDGRADLGQVHAAADAIAAAMPADRVVVVKSTVPLGTVEALAERMAARTPHRVQVAMNPEFLREGSAVEDFQRPDRVVIGARDEDVHALLGDLYAAFVPDPARILHVSIASAELIKYASNAMLATRISFINELSRLAERTGADIEDVRRGVGADERIGPAFLRAGVGYGGSCFPKDVRALLAAALERGVELEIVRAVHRVNESQKRVLLERIVERYGGNLTGRTFAVWGLAFKPNTDDMREAPSIVLIEGLLARGASIRAYDPVAVRRAQQVFGNRIAYCATNYEALEGADALAIVTDWPEFRMPDFDKVRSLLREPVVFDGRNLYSPARMDQMGFTYVSVGRPAVYGTD